VSDERAHAARLGQGQRVVVAGLAGLRLEPVGMGRDLSQQEPGMGQEPSLGWSRLDDALAAPPCLAAYSDAAVTLSCNLALQVATFVLVLAKGENEGEIWGAAHSSLSWRSSAVRCSIP